MVGIVPKFGTTKKGSETEYGLEKFCKSVRYYARAGSLSASAFCEKGGETMSVKKRKEEEPESDVHEVLPIVMSAIQTIVQHTLLTEKMSKKEKIAFQKGLEFGLEGHKFSFQIVVEKPVSKKKKGGRK